MPFTARTTKSDIDTAIVCESSFAPNHRTARNCLIASRIYWLREEYLEQEVQSSSKPAKHRAPNQSDVLPTVRSVYERICNDTRALSWFSEMQQGREGSSSDEAIGMARGGGTSQELGIGTTVSWPGSMRCLRQRPAPH
jgi:lipopolysaccharide biosynthesis regulator YciM